MKATWRVTGGVLACSLALFLAAYWATAESVYAQWRTSTHSHGLFVIPLSLYLAWRRRKRLEQMEPEASLWVLLLIPLLSFAWLVGELTATEVVKQFCFMAMIVALIWGAIGTRAAKVLAVPLIFLLFAVPMGESLIPMLQDYSAWSAVKLLDLTRVPAVLEGRIITIPSGKWEVAEACSGIHYLLATVTIGYFYADLMYRKWLRKAVFLAACVAVPVIANGIRVYGILLIDFLGGTQLARGVDHLIAGWIFLSAITILLLAAGMKWREKQEWEAHEGAGSGETESESAARKGADRILTRLCVFSTVGLLLAAAGPALARHSSGEVEANEAIVLRPAAVAPPWAPTGGRFDGWRPKLLPPDGEFYQSYAKQDRAVELYVAYYRPNGRGAKLVSSSNSLYGRPQWLRTGGKEAETVMQGKRVKVKQVSIGSGEEHLVLWSWYWVDGRFTSNPYVAKLLLGWARLRGSRRGSAALIVAAEDPGVGESGESVLRDFTGHLSLDDCLNAAASGAVQSSPAN
jgi:exosortase A